MVFRRLVVLLVAVILLVTLVPLATFAQARPFIYGANVAGVYTDQPRLMKLVNTAFRTKNTSGGRPWVRQQLAWQYTQKINRELAVDHIDPLVNAASANGVNILMSVTKSPSWATANGQNGMPSRARFKDFADYLQKIARRYRGKVQAYQIWNEQNYAVENGGNVQSASYYIELLAVAYDALKAVDPSIIVVSGGLTPTATNRADVALDDLKYFDQLFASRTFWAKHDVLGMHVAGTLNPPDAYAPNGPGPGWKNNSEFYFTRVEQVRKRMVAAGYASRKIWITEFGWTTKNVSRGFEYGSYNTLQEQAQWVQRAFQRGRFDYAPWMGGMFVWNMNFAVTGGKSFNQQDHMAGFSLLNVDWSPRPAFTAVQNMAKP